MAARGYTALSSRAVRQSSSMAVRTDLAAESAGCRPEEAPDAGCRLQDTRSLKAPEPEREQALPDSRDHVGTGEERVQARTLKRLPFAVVHQGAKTLSALDPGGVLEPVSAQSERGLEGAVTETAEASQN